MLQREHLLPTPSHGTHWAVGLEARETFPAAGQLFHRCQNQQLLCCCQKITAKARPWSQTPHSLPVGWEMLLYCFDPNPCVWNSSEAQNRLWRCNPNSAVPAQPSARKIYTRSSLGSQSALKMQRLINETPQPSVTIDPSDA